MRIPSTWQPTRPVNPTPALCPRRYWRSMNPALPPPDFLTCLARGPDCCATPTAADVRRVA